MVSWAVLRWRCWLICQLSETNRFEWFEWKDDMLTNEPAIPSAIDLLQSAFRSFDQAATSLQASYRALAERVQRLDLELAASNEALQIKLQENEELRSHLTAILESLTTGVIVADEADTIIRCNRAAEVLLGMPRSGLLGQRLSRFLQEKRLNEETYPLHTENGTAISLSRAVLQKAPGEAAGTILLVHDISAVLRLEARLQRRDRLAAMGEVVGRIAHEIRNPLGSIELFASLLRQDLAEQPALRQYAEHISMAVEAMDRLLSNLLFYMRPRRPRADWHSLESLVQDALMLTSHATVRKAVAVHLQMSDALPMIWCDAAQIKQVLVNLILNGVQAMAEGGQLTIDVTANPGTEPASIRIAITDTGTGIDPSHLSRIFDPFFTTKEEGTGLGLAIAHAIVEGHGGRIEVESVVNCGSTFTVVLPSGPGDRSAPDSPVSRNFLEEVR